MNQQQYLSTERRNWHREWLWEAEPHDRLRWMQQRRLNLGRTYEPPRYAGLLGPPLLRRFWRHGRRADA